MKRLTLLAVALLLPLTAAATSPDMSRLWSPEDSQLREMVDKFSKNFFQNEARYRASLERQRKLILDDPNLTPTEKAAKLQRAEKLYTKRSTRNVAQYKEPMLERMKAVANENLKKRGRIRDTVGEPVWIKDNTGKKRYNPNYGGAKSDKDMGGSAKSGGRFKKIVEHYFGKTVKGPDGKPQPTVTTTAHTVDAKFLEATVNTDPRHWDPETNRLDDPDALGGSSREAKYHSMARAPETYLSVSARRLGRKQMAAFDHFGKTGDARAMNAAAHVDPVNQDTVRPLYKATHKMVGDMDEATFEKIKAKTGYQGSFDDFKSQVKNLKMKSSMEAVGVDENNIAAFKATNEAVQDTVIQQKKAEWEAIRQNRIDELRRAEADLEKLSGEARDAKIAEIQHRKMELVDSDARMKAQIAMAGDLKNGKVERPRERVARLSADLPDKPTARARLNAKVGGMIEKAAPKLAMLGDGIQVFTTSYRATERLREGDYAGAAAEVGGAILEEGKDRLKNAIGNRIIPGYGNMKLAWDVGYGSGRLIGEHVKLYPGGPTVDEATQNFFEKAHDIVSGNRENRWNNKRIQDYQRHVNEMIDDWGAELPPGMTRAQALAWAIDKENKGGDFHKATEELFAVGDAIREEREKAERELAEARKEAALAEAEKAKAERKAREAKEAEEQALLAAKAAKKDEEKKRAVGGLHALLGKKKQEKQRGAAADGGGEGLGATFDRGTDTIQQYRKLEEAKKELAAAQRHLRETRARIAERERQREAENQAFWEGMSGFAQALSQGMQQGAAAYAAQRQMAGTASSRHGRPSSPAAGSSSGSAADGGSRVYHVLAFVERTGQKVVDCRIAKYDRMVLPRSVAEKMYPPKKEKHLFGGGGPYSNAAAHHVCRCIRSTGDPDRIDHCVDKYYGQ